MGRSVWKESYVSNNLLQVANEKKKIHGLKIFSRSSTILESFVGYDVQIHNGKSFKKIRVNLNMVGHKFGEFAWTRKYPEHKKKKK